MFAMFMRMQRIHKGYGVQFHSYYVMFNRSLALQQAHTEWKWCRSSVDLSNSCMCCSFRPIDGYWLKNRFNAFICNINFTWNIPSVHSVWVYVIFVANSMKSDGYCKALYVWVHTSRWKALAAGRQTEGTTIISIFPFINYFNYAA